MGAPERLREDPPLISKLEGLSEKENTLLQETVELWLNIAQSDIIEDYRGRVGKRYGLALGGCLYKRLYLAWVKEGLGPHNFL